jgi:hypothetical protein
MGVRGGSIKTTVYAPSVEKFKAPNGDVIAAIQTEAGVFFREGLASTVNSRKVDDSWLHEDHTCWTIEYNKGPNAFSGIGFGRLFTTGAIASEAYYSMANVEHSTTIRYNLLD